jgi:uncharacterized protein
MVLFALFFAAATPAATAPPEFMKAIREQDVAKVQSMLEADPSLVNAKSEKGIDTVTAAIFILIHQDSFMLPAKNRVLQLLLARHPTLDVWQTAALGTSEQLAKMLRADQVDVMNQFGWTPLHYAAFGGNVPNTKWLLDHGADMRLRAKTKFKNSPFLVAMLTRDPDTVKLFLDRGADVLERQGEGDTALHEAAGAGDLALVQLLVERGSDVNARDDQGMSALDYAVQDNHDETAAYLRSKGAK